MQESCSEQRRAAQALQHSSAQVAVLTNRLHTQQVLAQKSTNHQQGILPLLSGFLQITVNILQQQLGELQGAKDGLEISRRREDALQQQVRFRIMNIPSFLVDKPLFFHRRGALRFI